MPAAPLRFYFRSDASPQRISADRCPIGPDAITLQPKCVRLDGTGWAWLVLAGGRVPVAGVRGESQ